MRIADGRSNITHTYTYDHLHRLTQSNSSGGAPVVPMLLEYSYDDTSGASPLHAPVGLEVNSASYQPDYDANGNLTAGWDFTDPNAAVPRNVSFNAENMAAAVTRGGTQTAFLYDGDGQRAGKVQGSSSTYYIDDVFEVKNGNLVRYIFAGNLHIAMRENNTLTYFHKDHLGSSSVMTNAAGVEISSADYLPYGSNRAGANITRTSYQFTDQELDSETGLYNYDARLYDPIVGQFISADSIVPDWYDPQSLNRFAYVRNNPVKYVDPDGHSFLLAVAVGAGLAYLADAMLTPDIANNPLDSSEPLQNTSALEHAGSLVTGASVGTTLASTGVKAAVQEVVDEVVDNLTGGLSNLTKLGSTVKNASKTSKVCFIAGTPVETIEELKPIDSVKVGDMVLARDEVTGEQAYRKVTRIFVTPDQPILELTIANESGLTETFGTTAEHPFWVKNRGWIAAGELLAGDELFTSNGGWLKVAGSTWLSKRQTVYNIEVEQYHTYFVGDFGVWVHNACAKLTKSKKAKTGKTDKHSSEAKRVAAKKNMMKQKENMKD